MRTVEGGAYRQGRRDRHAGARRHRQFPDLFQDGASAAQAGRPVPASRDHAPRQEPAGPQAQEAARIRRADAIHLSRRRARSHRPHGYQSRAHGFEIHDVEGWREHYQRTCRFWHDRLLGQYDAACARSAGRRRGSGSSISPPARSPSSATASAFYQTLASKRVKGPAACRRRAPIFTGDRRK